VLLTPPLIIVMLTALFRVHLQYGFSSVRLKSITSAGAVFGPIGYEMNLLYIVALLALAAADPTPLSFDYWRMARRRRITGAPSRLSLKAEPL
jgi:putative oxidoreductase